MTCPVTLNNQIPSYQNTHSIAANIFLEEHAKNSTLPHLQILQKVLQSMISHFIIKSSPECGSSWITFCNELVGHIPLKIANLEEVMAILGSAPADKDSITTYFVNLGVLHMAFAKGGRPSTYLDLQPSSGNPLELLPSLLEDCGKDRTTRFMYATCALRLYSSVAIEQVIKLLEAIAVVLSDTRELSLQAKLLFAKFCDTLFSRKWCYNATSIIPLQPISDNVLDRLSCLTIHSKRHRIDAQYDEEKTRKYLANMYLNTIRELPRLPLSKGRSLHDKVIQLQAIKPTILHEYSRLIHKMTT
jgi:hypothetical protein